MSARYARAFALLLAAALAGACRAAPPELPPAHAAAWDPARLHVLVINGGGRPPQNFQSHLLHVRQLVEFLGAVGVRGEQVAIFSADGPDPAADLAVREAQDRPDFWLLQGTRLEGPLGRPVTYANSAVPGYTLAPATKAAITAWFAETRTRLHPGDTLLVYVTDHGSKNADDLTDNHITLWGENEFLSVKELRAELERLDPAVRVVTLMSQCYSGAFTHLTEAHATGDLPGGNVCGYFSTVADRPAYGCYPENRGKENVGYSFHFFEALRAQTSFPQAHLDVLVNDRTPDVPIRTSDEYLADMLRRVAEGTGQEPTPFIDDLLHQAWRNKAAWEPEIRLLDRIGHAFGMFSPRSLAELDEQTKRLPDISNGVKEYSKAWKGALGDLAEVNLDRFVKAEPTLGKRLADPDLGKLEPAAATSLTTELLGALKPYTRADTPTDARLRVLRKKSEAASAVSYRMEVRLGVVLRMRAILTSIAGRVYLATRGREEKLGAYEALRACEDLTLGTGDPLPVTMAALAPPEPFPAYEEDERIAEKVQPAWMGIRFKALAASQRETTGLREGATAVVTVYPDSPAQAAGFEVGDIVVGPVGAPFTERNQIREWTMLSPVGAPAPLVIRRGDDELRLTLVPKPFPLQWPALPGPPKEGTDAPPVTLSAYRGTAPHTLTDGTPRLLFFWATWCAPCKASLPEVLAFEQERHAPVIAITDELAETLDPFFQAFAKPFPATVAIDEFRKAFLAYGVSGTPTFVLVDGGGKVQAYATGYNAEKGLGFDGWKWAGRDGATKGKPASFP